MIKKAHLTLLAGFLMFIMVLTGCFLYSGSDNAGISTTQPVTDTSPVSYLNWWEKYGEPQYGGTLNIAGDQLGDISFKPVSSLGGQYQIWAEALFGPQWQLDRNTWSYYTDYMPVESTGGWLADSWEQTGPLTMTVYLRQGVYWWDKSPVNGREFDANDVQFNYDRILGTGSGFTKPGSLAARFSDIESVVAVDKYTVEFRMKRWTVQTLQEVFSPLTMQPPEAATTETATTTTISALTDLATTIVPTDINEAIGTGPWIPTAYYRASSLTLSRNPNYWNVDECYPENKLPYLDTIKYIAMANDATAEAALRTGKVDIKSDSRGLSWQQVKKLAQTNPDLHYIWVPGAGLTLELRTDKEPFSDIRVRQALQMAIDRQAIAGSIYGGSVDGTPSGLISPAYKKYAYTFDKWSSELKEIYGYNPEKARQLLAAANYAEGFETTILLDSQDNLELLHILTSEFKEIRVTLDYKMIDSTVYMAKILAGKQEQIILEHRTGMTATPYSALSVRLSDNRVNFTHNTDTVYDSLVDRLESAATAAEAQQLSVEADKYALEQCWSINLFPMATSVLWQSYLKGYSGEYIGPYAGFYYARCWIKRD